MRSIGRRVSATALNTTTMLTIIEVVIGLSTASAVIFMNPLSKRCQRVLRTGPAGRP